MTGRGIPTRLNDCVTFIVNIIYKCDIRPRGTRVGDPHVRMLWSFRREWNASDAAVLIGGQPYCLWCCVRLGSRLNAVVASGLHDRLSWNLGYVKARIHHSQSVSDYSTCSFPNAGRSFRITTDRHSKINVRTSLQVAAVAFTSCSSVWCCRIAKSNLNVWSQGNLQIKSLEQELAREPNWSGLFGCDPVDIRALLACLSLTVRDNEGMCVLEQVCIIASLSRTITARGAESVKVQ
jgi:hypothetical protein